MALKITDEQNYQDIADAIRSKLGSSDTFLPSEMADAVESIPTGVSEEVPTIFIDYDGTVLHEYTQAEVDALTALPTLPSHQGLTCQGWNWTLAELQAFQKPAVVGANYITDDGKTRVYITIPEDDRYVKVSVSAPSVFRCTVDWGDGSTSELLRYSSNAEHTYVSGGDYVISFAVTEGTAEINGTSTIGSKLVSSGQTSGGPYGAASNVEKIEFGAGLTIGDYACAEMKNLKAVTIPCECSFKENSFASCYSLPAFVFPRVISECDSYMFHSDYGLEVVALSPAMTVIPSYFFTECRGLKRVSLPDGITAINDYAFNNCSNLNGLILPQNIQSIGRNAFCYVGSFSETVMLPSTLTSIGNSAFSHTSYEKLIINGALSLGTYAFSSNATLKEVEINSIIAAWNSDMFTDCSSLEKITVAEGNETIGELIALKAYRLKQVILPDSLTAISHEAFGNCYSLEDIDLPSDVSEIGSYAFSGCHMIKSMVIPEGVTNIATYAFASMETLKDIVFLGDVKKIEKNAFSMTYGLKSVDLTHCTAVPVLENTNAFAGNSTRLKIKVPAALYADWIIADKWSSITNYIVSA